MLLKKMAYLAMLITFPLGSFAQNNEHSYFKAKALGSARINESAFAEGGVFYRTSATPAINENVNERIFLATDIPTIQRVFGESQQPMERDGKNVSDLFLPIRTVNPLTGEAKDIYPAALVLREIAQSTRSEKPEDNEIVVDGSIPPQFERRLHSIRMLVVAPAGDRFNTLKTRIINEYHPTIGDFITKVELYYQLPLEATSGDGGVRRIQTETMMGRDYLYYVVPGSEYAKGAEEEPKNRVCTQNIQRLGGKITIEVYTNEVFTKNETTGDVVRSLDSKLSEEPKRTLTVTVDELRTHLKPLPDGADPATAFTDFIDESAAHQACSIGW